MWIVRRRSVLLVCVFVLLVPAGVLGREILLFEGFDKLSYSFFDLKAAGAGDYTVRDGYLFLNLTAKTLFGGAANSPSFSKWKYVGLETRVRCSSDNQLQTDVGGGRREWGLGPVPTKPGGGYLVFRSESSESDRAGFWACSYMEYGKVVWVPIEGIDISEWHTYTILWQPNNATFLVDGEEVAVVGGDAVPSVKMGTWAEIWNVVLDGGDYDTVRANITFPCYVLGRERVCTDEYIQVDYVEVFRVPELALFAVVGLILLPALLRNVYMHKDP